MGRLGDLLESIFEAPRGIRAVHIRARHVEDANTFVPLHEWWNRQQEMPGSRGALLITASSDDASDKDEDGTRYELWRAASDHWRADRNRSVTILDGDARLTYTPAMGGFHLPTGERRETPWSGVLHPRGIVDRCDIEIRADDVVAGRTCWSLELQLRAGEVPRFRNPFMRSPWMGTEHSCRIDQETGVVLAVEGRFEGAVCSAWTTTTFELTETIDPAVFAFVPPDGRGFRSYAEFRVESMRRAGIDLTDVDVNDEDQLNEAMLRHHRKQFPSFDMTSLPSPTDFAEQHIPTGPPPDDLDEAERAVRDAFERMVTLSEDGEAVPAVEGGSNLGASLRDAGDRATAGANTQATVQVDHLKFLGPDEAVVWYTLLRNGHPVLRTVEGRARRTRAQWLVSRPTFAQLVGSVGVRIPPPAET